jgi:hypothetical protein
MAGDPDSHDAQSRDEWQLIDVIAAGKWRLGREIVRAHRTT